MAAINDLLGLLEKASSLNYGSPAERLSAAKAMAYLRDHRRELAKELRTQMDAVPVSCISLTRVGKKIEVAAQISGRYVRIIREPADSSISHYVSAEGIRQCAEATP